MDRTRLWVNCFDEPVKTNQKALIDTVLARYSGEFTVFRELLQNADDADARCARIHFKTNRYIARDKSKETTSQGLPDLDRIVSQWTVQNDGRGFESADWDRLMTIADGNPNERNIGAFGVGFYSVFSVTDKPVVISVDPHDGERHGMAFHWVKDQLFVRRGALPSGTSGLKPGNYWTKFKMALRNPASLPGHPMEIARFLSTSLTFMAQLEEVSVYFDGHCLTRVTKEIGVLKELGLPRDLRGVSPEGMMTIAKVKSIGIRMKAEIMRLLHTGEPSVLSLDTSQDFKEMVAASIQLTVFSASIDVRVDRRTTEELIRATKKKPPARCIYQLLYMGKMDCDFDGDEEVTSNHWTSSIFQDLRTGVNSTGAARIFIGHATAQTTGMGGHVSARFIPTVERALIELADETHHETIASRWNKELLFVGGHLARTVYEHLIENIRTQCKVPPETNSIEIGRALQQEFAHIFRFFTFYPSAPTPAVSRIVEDVFFSCALSGCFPVVSTVGIKDVRQVRLYDSAFSGFMKELPTLPMEVTEAMTASLQKRGLVRKISFADVIQELQSRPLTLDELMECLKWWKNSDAGTRDHSYRNQLLSAMRFFAFSSNEKGEQTHTTDTVIRLESIRTFIDPPNKFPLDLPLPPHTFPAVADQSLNLSTLGPDLGWSALTVVEWVENLTSKFTLDSSPAGSNLMASELFATQILWFLAQVWTSPPVVEQHHEIVNKLKEVPCIPTQCGTKRPDEAYLKASIFPDLPVVSFPKGEAFPPSLNRMLLTLGVRESVKLQLVFDRMVNTRYWSNSQLVTYLVQNKRTLTLLEQQRLKEAPAFLKEESNEERVQRSSFLEAASISAQGPERYAASQLHEPTDTLRQLDLPILDWDTNSKWRADSDEARLLFELGLNRRPAIYDLLERAACDHPALSKAAFQYFMENFSSYAPVYEVAKFSEIPFVPSVRPDGSPCLAKPNEVFIDSDSSIMEFLVVDPSFRLELVACSELQLKGQPPIKAIIARLLSRPPSNHEAANRIFSYLDKRKNDFTPAEFIQLRVTRMIPVRNHSGSSEETTSLKAVLECFVGEPRAAFHSELFPFISGFDGAARAFLRACGIKEEPTVGEIIQKIISEPQKFYESAGGTEMFLEELQYIALNWMQVDRALQDDMRRSPMFLGQRRIIGASPSAVSQDVQDTLLPPDQIVIVDDEAAYGLFFSELYGAPQEIILEELYFSLGSPRLSTLVREKPEFQGRMLEDPIAKKIRVLILERLPLFLREYRSVHQQPLITVDELSQDGNFLAKTVGQLQSVKILDWPSQNLRVEKKSDASAAGFREKKGGPIHLLLARNIPLDIYEVAHSMCDFLFYQHRASDSALLASILLADLETLKRRGYNVDAPLSLRQSQLANRGANVGTHFPGTDYFAGNSFETRVPPRGVSARSILIYLLSLFQKFKRSHSLSITHPQRMQFIDANIDVALSCKGGCVPLSSILPSPSHPPHVSILQKTWDGVVYCDTSSRHEDFIPSGEEVNGYRVHVKRGILNNAQWLTEKKDALDRFTTRIIDPLRELYNLPMTHIHVIYTDDIRLAAFNHDNSIFLNLHYYETSHDEKVLEGAPNTALTFWYFALAHEIAHNLVEEHNASHGYFFSHICERFLSALTSLITQPDDGTQAGFNAEG
ncbi:hypothetical protein BOTBODRAFT_68536 [Botryobasidium botryosum FD-172 SS1]|uniref:Sacsin/Nov domain-containing protein n=1 Tax=Botryobasidium botryosum (strain FD-172 SS1) TaxID=930990 RepID=A0A067MFF9_BOTB1|nr:hypothetical protein BOTBODRAFT_68536 [Botryobasidium botryosum FD-172 SS1]